MRNALFLLACLLIGTSASHTNAQLPKKIPTTFECRWANGKIKIDGKGDDKAWSDAPWINTFYLPWLQDKARLARTSTKAKLLWDRDYVYFYAEMEDGDLYADIKEDDGRLWENDVFELFFKPAVDKPGYYEFQVNPANAKLDVFMPRRNAGGFQRFQKDFPFEFDTKVILDGTLNRWQDKDKGWSVEGRLSWKSFVQTGGRPKQGETWKFTLCRYDYSVDFEGPELSTCAPLKSKTRPDFHHHEDYADLKFIGPGQTRSNVPYGKMIRKRAPITTSKIIGSPEPPKPYRVVKSYPNLNIGWPICMERIPGTDYLLVINEARSYAPARLHLMKDDPNVKETTTLIDFKGVAYDVAFHPEFNENGFLYVGRHDPKHKDGPHCQIVRYVLKKDKGWTFDKASEKVIIEWDSNGHNGAAIDFGLDGKLYVTTGDGTVRRDTDVVGQRLDVLRAKVLRIDVDKPAPGKAYSVPKDNPFVSYPKARPETWCYGLRNPWRITVDKKTGHVWVGNNGQDSWEQIYLIAKGANYGWSVYEGANPFITEREAGPTPIVKPTFDHPHLEARSLTGGIVYHGRKYPELQGAYLYGDYSTGKVWAAKHDGKKVTWHKEIADTTLAITCFAVNKDGDILIADHGKDGGFYRLEKRPENQNVSKFPRRLSETGLFTNVSKHQLIPDVIPYFVNVDGWHDGATIQRYLAIPKPAGDEKDLVINLNGKRGWDLPNRTVLIQTLSLPLNEKQPEKQRRLETRILTRQEGEWLGYSYLWNEKQTDAELVESAGTTLKLSLETGRGKETRTWHVPSRTECMSCHSRAAKYVLGMSTLQMNHNHDYGDYEANQLSILEAQNYFRSNWFNEAKDQWEKKLRQQLTQEAKNKNLDTSAFDKLLSQRLENVIATRNQRKTPPTTLLSRPFSDYPALPDPFDKNEDLDRRAKSYLHVNCAHCHVLDGGGNARIVVEWGTETEKMNLIDVAPMHGTFGIPDAKLVTPGFPDRSVLTYRLSSLGSGRMPRLGSHHIDEKGLNLIREWITGMKPAANNNPIVKKLEKLKSLNAEMRQKQLTQLLGTTNHALAILPMLEKRAISESLSKEILEVATTQSTTSVRDLFERFLPEEKRIQRLGNRINPLDILQRKGDVIRGKQLFFSQRLTCASCHQIQGQGRVLGPDLSMVGKKHVRNKLLDQVLEPSGLIEPKFATYVIQTKRGQLYSGLILEKSDQEVVVKDTNHKITRVSLKSVERITPQTRSLMPDLLLKDLTAQEAADLLEYLSSLK